MKTRSIGATALLTILAAAPAAADWLVFAGGAVTEIRGGWEVRGRQVVFHAPSGELQSIAVSELDLAASAFLTSEVSRIRPAPAPGARAASPAERSTEPVCRSGRAIGTVDAERIVVAGEGGNEIVRLACTDAPRTNALLEPVVHYAARARDGLGKFLLVKPSVCLEPSGALAGADENRVAYVRLADGRDLGAELIRSGFATAGSSHCERREAYEAIEQSAAAQRAGLWAETSQAAVDAILAALPRFHGAGRHRR
jgi:endonuclease YncB( thermonuclease family)